MSPKTTESNTDFLECVLSTPSVKCRSLPFAQYPQKNRAFTVVCPRATEQERLSQHSKKLAIVT